MVTKDKLLELCHGAIKKTLDYSSQQLGFSLPRDCTHGLMVEGYRGEIYTRDELIELLYDGRTFPQVVDLAVRGIHDPSRCPVSCTASQGNRTRSLHRCPVSCTGSRSDQRSALGISLYLGSQNQR